LIDVATPVLTVAAWIAVINVIDALGAGCRTGRSRRFWFVTVGAIDIAANLPALILPLHEELREA
jgi:hypothetical protein